MDQTQSQSAQPTAAEIHGEELMATIMARIANVLTDEDMQVIEKLDGQDDEKGTMVQNYLRAKVPNFDAIMKEEMDFYAASQ